MIVMIFLIFDVTMFARIDAMIPSSHIVRTRVTLYLDLESYCVCPLLAGPPLSDDPTSVQGLWTHQETLVHGVTHHCTHQEQQWQIIDNCKDKIWIVYWNINRATTSRLKLLRGVAILWSQTNQIHMHVYSFIKYVIITHVPYFSLVLFQSVFDFIILQYLSHSDVLSLLIDLSDIASKTA